MATEHKHDVFISYSRKDIDIVKTIKNEIESSINARCWMDLEGIPYNSPDYVHVIVEAINEAPVFLFMLSQNSQNSSIARGEITLAQKKKKHIVLININDCEVNDEFTILYSQHNMCDYSSKHQKQKLLKEIKAFLTKSAEEKHIPTKIRGTYPIVSETTISNKLEFVANGIPFAMIKVETGAFQMGIESRTVVLSKDYYLGEAPVTQRLWTAIMQKNPSRFKGDDKPVDSVSWNDCQLFLNRLNYLLKMDFRLPTEAEWEFAARGGLLTHNYLYSGSNQIEDVAWCKMNSNNQTHPVKLKKPNELLLYDMSGNVWEWCYDYYEELQSVAQRDPTGPLRGIKHVYKGGCWVENEDCQVTARKADLPSFTSYGGLGLRLALTF